MGTQSKITLIRRDSCRWEISPDSMLGMRVPGMIYASAELLPDIENDEAVQQVANVACLPGIVNYSLAMPDIHWGYGFPIGGVAATDPENGVISPGGVGYDISCGVRLIRTELEFSRVQPFIKDLVYALFATIPCGVGSTGPLKLPKESMRKLLTRGAQWVIEEGWGKPDDLDFLEERGNLKSADETEVSHEAKERGKDQLGTLGSGNHFLEIQRVETIYDKNAATIMGLFENQVVVMIHSGSRGLGYQVCDDFLGIMKTAGKKYAIELPDWQLACAPIQSEEGQRYLLAMAAAANFGMANRQLMTHLTREIFQRVFSSSPKELGMDVIYDVCHNIAKFEEHRVQGKSRRLCVHRKGATRAFPAGHPQIPARYKSIGQPVLVPGDMGRCSYVLVGLPGAMEQTFGSTCHGAGRQMSRTKAIKSSKGRNIKQELEDQNIFACSRGKHTLNEEMSEAYKDVSKVVEICERTGISKKVAKLRPIGVIKG